MAKKKKNAGKTEPEVIRGGLNLMGLAISIVVGGSLICICEFAPDFWQQLFGGGRYWVPYVLTILLVGLPFVGGDPK